MFEYQAIMVDLSRGRIPRLETLCQRIDFLHEHGLNGVFLYMECVVAGCSLPAVGCGDTPVNKTYLQGLREFCEARNVVVAPIFQILGHQEKLLALEEFEPYAELSIHDGPTPMNNIRADSAEMRNRMLAYIEELLPYFNAPFVHLGLDEAFTLGKGRSQALVAKHGLTQVIADYVQPFYDLLAGKGRDVMIWSDFVLHFPELIKKLPKELILTNWGYGKPDQAYEYDNGHFRGQALLASEGHRLWYFGCNQSEYIFPGFDRLLGHLDAWLELADTHGGGGFVVCEWGDVSCNLQPSGLGLFGDFLALHHINDRKRGIKALLEAWSETTLGHVNDDYVDALLILGKLQDRVDYFGERIVYMGPFFQRLMLDDPKSSGAMARQFASIPDQGIAKLLADAREAHRLLSGVEPGDHHPEIVQDLQHVAERVLATALRAQLWHAHIWDTGYIWDDHESQKAAWLAEYQERIENDIAWYNKKWDRDNLSSKKAETMRRLVEAKRSLEAL